MSEAPATRGGSSRGRGGFRGGRGGYRGGRTASRTKREDNEQENIPPTSLDDQGEVGELKRKYGDQVPILREVLPGWSDEDLVYALQETDGDAAAAVDRISSGTISQWGEVKKKQPKSKDAGSSAETGAGRGRGRGHFEGRGRGRGAERGARGAGRGARVASQANGTSHTATTTNDGSGESVKATTEATGGWDTAPTNGDNAATNDWANEPGQDALGSLQTEEAKPAAAAAPANTKKPGGWAGLFAKPPPAPKAAPTPVPVAQPEEIPAVPAPDAEPEDLPQTLPPPIEPQIVEDGPSELPSAPHSDTAADLPPAKDELTETNLEQLPDSSNPVGSQTVASTAASTQDPLTQATASKAPVRPMSGYHATALKATGGAGRSTSYNRKILEQQEAVVMPGNHAVEKAAVQFGKMGLNGDSDLDVDEDREEPETRTQLPDDSPSAPRASLPPSAPDSQPTSAPAPVDSQVSPDAGIPQRHAPGLPPAPQQPAQSAHQAYAEQYRYGPPGKPAYDPFAQPPSQPTAQASHSQEPFSSQVPGQTQPGTAQNDYSQYYNSREAYQQYYNQYGHGQDAQRTGSAFGTSSQEAPSQYATARAQQGYGQQDAQGSGQNTPAPTTAAHQPQHSQHMAGQGSHGGYPYGYPAAYSQQYPQYGANYMNQMSQQHRYGANRPMFDDARRQQDDYYASQQQQQQQYGYSQNQQYASSYKSGMYGQPQHQYSYDQHSSSPANVGNYGARDASYGRSGSTQPTESQQTTASSHGYNMPDPFGRSSSGFGQQGLTQQHSAHGGSEDASKGNGPSPSVQAGRPGSTVNNSQAQQAGFPAQSQHSSQQAFSGYPQYGNSGFGNFGGQQQQQQTAANQGQTAGGYGGYGSNAFGAYNAGYGSGRGAWHH